MKKTLFLALALITAGITVDAQTTGKPLKQVMELKMPKTVDDDMPGTRGAGVAWHPVQKKYYASFAGNVGYPMAVFDKDGKRLSDDELITMADTRGLWYNPATKLLSGNAYSDYGWFTYKLDKAGIPEEAEFVQEGMNQPDVQSTGVYNTIDKQVLFLRGVQVYKYSNDAELQDSLVIHWGRKKADAEDEHDAETATPEDYNYTTLIYTGIKGQELGFLNIANKQVELYNIKTGFLTKVLTLPDTATVESLFNFAYTNGIYWLFNIEERKWVGYK